MGSFITQDVKIKVSLTIQLVYKEYYGLKKSSKIDRLF